MPVYIVPGSRRPFTSLQVNVLSQTWQQQILMYYVSLQSELTMLTNTDGPR